MARILFVTQTASWGGVDVWLEETAGALAQNHEVIVGLVRGARFHDPDRYRAARRLPPTIEVSAPTATPEGRARALARVIDEIRPDIVVPVNVADVLEAVRRLKRQNRQVRLLYPLHALDLDYFLDVRMFRGIVDCAVGTNRLTVRALERVSGVSSERCAYARYGVPRPLRAPQPAPSDPIELVYAGRLTQLQKRVRDLIATCESLDRRSVGYRLEIAGGGDEEAWLRRAFVKRDNVRFAGVLSTADLYARVYPGKAVCLIFSDWETGPIVAWEAMRNGATVVTSDFRGLRPEGRLVNGLNCVVVPVGDTEAFAGAIETLWRDGGLLTRLRAASIETAERECTLELSGAEWSEAVARCLALPLAMDARVVMRRWPRGRLDRLLGVGIGETVRSVLGSRALPANQGAEWPHTFGIGDATRDESARRLADLDA